MALRTSTGTLVIGSGSASSSALSLRGAVSGHVTMPDSLNGTILTFDTSADGAIYRPLYGTSGLVTPAASVAGSRSYPLPSELFGAHSFRLTAGTVQASDRSFIISLRGGR